MDYSKIGLFAMMKNKMRYMSERQAVISKNIANADTPGFIPRDLKQVDFKTLTQNAMGNVHVATTNAMHIEPKSSSSFNSKKRQTFETTPVGNAVVLEEEAMKMAENNVDYQATTTAYKKIVEMFRLVTSGNR